ncbi:MAG TPA: bifunctional DNA-formamidopyrimidine glycosylase/DNA-(apurinic or apyrimidinic site) lyase [Candidatus Woesebacteria bacterium]|nr:bifunctional DNA-formamidopyrimidine glycosylase/DNA-(apurinic or apyrimidinic site) lyase [Candidatus Woesebacteria bacterium]
MPELPEVESIRRKLNLVLLNRQIQQIEVLRDKSFLSFSSLAIEISNQTVLEVRRRAKILQIVLSGKRDLLIHLKMTGQLIFVDTSGQRVGGGHPTADWVNDLPTKHTRVIFTFADGSRLFFNDMRVFGWIRSPLKQDVDKEFVNYGPDVNDPNLTVDYLLTQAQRRFIPIKQFIMDNKVLSGVGNIYASEALFAVGINPQRPAREISAKEMTKLLQAMQVIIERSIQLGGTTFDGKYVGVDGFAGGFQSELKVYGRSGKPCLKCGTEIQKIKQAGRGTFFCPTCQCK